MDADLADKFLKRVELCKSRSEVGALKSVGALWLAAAD
jgi:ribosomal 50S subunit-recycling heat shock protein